MNYSEKLKDRRWLQFRGEFIESRRRGGRTGYANECDDCGEDTAGSLHVHHKRYIRGREPWEYDYEDLRLLCEGCHKIIHDLEQDTRAFILTLPPWACHEFRDMFEELLEAHAVSDHCFQVACAHAKNGARSVVYSYQQEPGHGTTLAEACAALDGKLDVMK